MSGRDERLTARELRVAGCGEDAAAVAVSRRPERALGDQLARDAERYGPTAVRHEHH